MQPRAGCMVRLVRGKPRLCSPKPSGVSDPFPAHEPAADPAARVEVAWRKVQGPQGAYISGVMSPRAAGRRASRAGSLDHVPVPQRRVVGQGAARIHQVRARRRGVGWGRLGGTGQAQARHVGRPGWGGRVGRDARGVAKHTWGSQRSVARHESWGAPYDVRGPPQHFRAHPISFLSQACSGPALVAGSEEQVLVF